MQFERSRASRHPIATSIDITDVESETHLSEQTSDPSLFGCHVDTQKPLSTGTKVRIRSLHTGANFAALGRVAYVQHNGMGVVFTEIEANN